VTGLQYAVSDTLVLAKRSFLRIPRQPDLLIGFTVQPVMIIVQSMIFGGFVTALGLSDDLKKGLIDRFRSLPMWPPAVLTGRTIADIFTNVVQLVVMLVVGFVIGFRFATGAPEVIAGIALCLLLGYAFSWVFALIGLTASSPEAANAIGFTVLFPVTFVSSAFVPVESMPGWLQPIAEYNPFTTMVDATRALFVGTPAGNDVWGAVAWGIGITVVFGVASAWRYRRAVGR
jgi:ABC-2 type transport system permease protein/oleandomycin transport system permease protein